MFIPLSLHESKAKVLGMPSPEMKNEFTLCCQIIKFLGKCWYARHLWIRLAMESESMVEKGINFNFCLETVDTTIWHHAFILIFIALWAVITHYVTILMPILSYFTRFT